MVLIGYQIMDCGADADQCAGLQVRASVTKPSKVTFASLGFSLQFFFCPIFFSYFSIFIFKIGSSR
jgi:hypothetical protein